MSLRPLTFSFIIPVRNDATGLRRCLQSIASSKLPADQHEVVVADNGSVDGTVEVARAAGARVLLLPGLRVSELRNRAATVASGDILAFVDADHEIVESWPLVAREHLAAASVGAAGAPYSSPPRGTWVQQMYDTFRNHRPGVRNVSWLGSGNLAVTREVFLKLGGFDGALEACEDVDFCQRLRAAGYSLLADSRLASVHHGDPATLRALFRSELWRGRDNLRVSLRGGISIRTLPSMLIPIVDLLCMGTVLFGCMTFTRAGVGAAAAAALTFAALSAARAWVMRSRLTTRRSFDAGRAFAVASVYDVARALALTLQIRHRRANPPIVAEATQS